MVAALCASLTLGCNKASEKTSTTETTSAEIDLGTAPTAPTAPKDDYLATIRREQLVLRGHLEEAIAGLDHEIGDLQKAPHPNSAAIRELTRRRQTLEADALVVDRSDERGWDELKATVEHDLEGEPQM